MVDWAQVYDYGKTAYDAYNDFWDQVELTKKPPKTMPSKYASTARKASYAGGARRFTPFFYRYKGPITGSQRWYLKPTAPRRGNWRYGGLSRMIITSKGNAYQEMKYLDSLQTEATVNSLGSYQMQSVNFVIIGTAATNRIGRRIHIRKIQLRIHLTLPNSTTRDAMVDRVRIVVFLNKQTNGAAPAWTDLYVNANIDSFRNLDQAQQFRILMDKTIGMSSKAAAGDGATDQYVGEERTVYYNKSCNIPIEYQASGGTIGDISSNNIGVFMITENGRITASIDSRIRFYG